jgi:hypothetical protein
VSDVERTFVLDTARACESAGLPKTDEGLYENHSITPRRTDRNISGSFRDSHSV